MYLISFGTRPEILKLIPVIILFKRCDIPYKTLFTGQHAELIQKYIKFIKFIDKIDYYFEDVMVKGQSLNKLVIKIIDKVEDILTKDMTVIVQGDTTSAMSIALSAFNTGCRVVHVEAGLRTDNKYSPYPEEMNRRIISQIADIHLCPTKKAVENLMRENITTNVYHTGNTIVEMYNLISMSNEPSENIKKYLSKNYLLVSLHRRENRGEKMIRLWKQLTNVSKKYDIVYLTHPSLKEVYSYLDNTNTNTNIHLLDPVCYEDMVFLIKNCKGIISDSGGIQEEAVCASKKILICRDTTERPETIECGLGKLVDDKIIENLSFFEEEEIMEEFTNPYGDNIIDNILKVLKI